MQCLEVGLGDTDGWMDVKVHIKRYTVTPPAPTGTETFWLVPENILRHFYPAPVKCADREES